MGNTFGVTNVLSPYTITPREVERQPPAAHSYLSCLQCPHEVQRSEPSAMEPPQRIGVLGLVHRFTQRRRIDLHLTAKASHSQAPSSSSWFPHSSSEVSLDEPHKRIRLSHWGLPAPILTVPPHIAPRVVLEQAFTTSFPAFRVWEKALCSCVHSPFMTAIKAPISVWRASPIGQLENFLVWRIPPLTCFRALCRRVRW